MRRPRKAPALDPSKPCDLSKRRPNSAGYPVRRAGGRMVLVHRHTWESEVGPLRAGVQLHHVCHEKACRELAHLMPVTDAEHRRLHAEESTHCRAGHLRTPENTYVNPRTGERKCRDCQSVQPARIAA